MMKVSFKILLVAGVLFFAGTILSGCSDPRIRTSAGLNVHFGPGGPYVSPSINVGVYSGGRR